MLDSRNFSRAAVIEGVSGVGALKSSRRPASSTALAVVGPNVPMYFPAYNHNVSVKKLLGEDHGAISIVNLVPRLFPSQNARRKSQLSTI